MRRDEIASAKTLFSSFDVVFIAPTPGSPRAPVQRTVAFAPGQPLPRVGECVIIAFEGGSSRWQVEDVAHIFEDERHGVAIKLAHPDG